MTEAAPLDPGRGRLVRRAHAAFVLAASLYALVTALRTPPRPYGDAPEYLLMLESLARHASPELREADLEAVKRRFLAWGVEFPPHGMLIGFYPAEDGERYSYHFWAYSLACLPARWALGAVGVDLLKAPQLTNALLLSAALAVVFYFAPLGEGRKLLLSGLLYFSPAVWFVLWPHPEVYSFALTVSGLVFALRRDFRLAILLVALGALQNPQLGLLVVGLWLAAVVRGRLSLARRGAAARLSLRWNQALGHALPALTLGAYPLFYWLHFGTPSVVTEHATSIEKLSLDRALGLVFDLNVGLLPYLPVAVLAYLVAVGRALLRRRLGHELGLAVVLAAILLANTLQWNYNHGTSGPSRYVVWLTPLVFTTLVVAPGGRAWTATLAAAVAVQAGVVASRGGLDPRYDYLEHSPVAAFVLDRAPWLYDPDYEVFIKRTLHVEGRATQGPYAYTVGGECRKVLANDTHEEAVRRLCGHVPERDLPFFRSEKPAGRRRPQWKYLDY